MHTQASHVRERSRMVIRIASLGAAIAMALLIAAAGAGVPLQAQEKSTDQHLAKGDKTSKITFTQLRKDINQPNCRVAGDYPGYACAATTADERQNAEIWVMDDADGAELRQLTYNDTWDLGAVWSPGEEKTIAFHGGKYDSAGNLVFSPRIFVIPADSTDGVAQELTPGFGDRNADKKLDAGDCTTNLLDESLPCGAQWPSWSPDGSKIAFQEAVGNDLFVMDAKDEVNNTTGLLEPDGFGDNLVRLVEQVGQKWEPVKGARPDWNSNGNQIAFQNTGRSGNADIWVMDVADTNGDGKLESSNFINLTANPSSDQAPNLSPDDSRIVFHSDRDDPGKKVEIGGALENLNELYVMDLARDSSGKITGPADPANLTRLTKCTWDANKETCADAEPAGSPRNLDPDWSPNGKEIAFDKHVTLDDPPYSIRLTDAVLETFVMDAKDDETILADGSIVVGPDGQGDNLKQLTQLPSETGHAGWGTS